jgi:hypothetical protein
MFLYECGGSQWVGVVEGLGRPLVSGNLGLEICCSPCVKVRAWEYRLFRCVWVMLWGVVINDNLEQGVVLYICGLFGDECTMLVV